VLDTPGWQSGQALRLLLQSDLPPEHVTGRAVRSFARAGNELRVWFPRQATLLAPRIPFAAVPDATGWSEVRWSASGDVRVRIHDGDGGLPSSDLLPGNFAGFDGGTVSLSGLDPGQVRALRLGATLTRHADEDVAALLEWEVRWSR